MGRVIIKIVSFLLILGIVLSVVIQNVTFKKEEGQIS